MDLLAVAVIFAVIAAVAAFLSAPLRRRRDDDAPGALADELAELEARKEAKYREIRDADLDRRTGKLSDDDYRELDRQLRAEAVAILREIDELAGEVR